MCSLSIAASALLVLECCIRAFDKELHSLYIGGTRCMLYIYNECSSGRMGNEAINVF
jgi:hypothetical protein